MTALLIKSNKDSLINQIYHVTALLIKSYYMMNIIKLYDEYNLII